MRRLLAGLVVVSIGTVAAACASDSRTASTTPQVSTPLPSTKAVVHAVPVGSTYGADTGCVDQAGTFQGHAKDWYQSNSATSLTLSGDKSSSAKSQQFAATSATATSELAPTFTLDSQWEYTGRGGCVTHRYAKFTRGDQSITVSAWRIESVANPSSVPNEGPFRSVDDTTLVSEGEHISVVLAVAPDGTTSRVAAYGARAELKVAGWPTTVPANPSDPAPGPTPVPTEVLIALAHRTLDALLAERSQ